MGSVNNKELNDENINELQTLEGSLLVVGASFFNEWHILEILNKNEKLKSIYYVYYGNKDEAFDFVLNNLEDFNKNIFLIDSNDFYNAIRK